MRNFSLGNFFKLHIGLLLPVIVFLVISSIKIFELPGSWYGDISEEHEYLTRILSGEFPYTFVVGAGPVYHYLITPIVAILGQSYETYKIASVVVGVLGIVAIFFLANELSSRRLAFFAALITALSFWYISWSRTGSTPVVVAPLLSSLTVLGAVRFRKNHRIHELVLGIFASSLGLFTHPSTFLLPVVFFILLLSDAIIYGSKRKMIALMLGVLVGFLPAFILFTGIIREQHALFLDPHGYIGRKVFGIFQEDPWSLLSRTGIYARKTLLMLHVTGDQTFRVNVPGSPHLDPVSSVFFLVGLAYWIVRKKNDARFVTASMVILVLPSMFPTALPGEVPSMTRTLVATPFIFLTIAGGLDLISRAIARVKPLLGYGAVVFLFLLIGAFNLTKYFREYPKTLPNRNSAFDKIIASYIDTLPLTTPVFLTSCCWGDWGEPEPKAIYYRLTRKDGRSQFITKKFIRTCDDVPLVQPVVLIGRPDDEDFYELVRSCFPMGTGKIHEDRLGQRVFHSYFIPAAKNEE